MARKPRIIYPGALYHVILRGNAGQTIFFDDKDRTHLYLLLQEGIERFGHRVHGFCLMTNHVVSLCIFGSFIWGHPFLHFLIYKIPPNLPLPKGGITPLW